MSKPSFEEALVQNPGVMHNRNITSFVNRKSYERLKKDYAYAEAEGFDSLLFMDRQILTSYAKFLVEYLSHHFEH
jgi:hypothetical protein